MADIAMDREESRPRRLAPASAIRDDIRMFLAVLTVVLAMGGVGLFLHASIAQVAEQLGARMTSMEARMTGLENRIGGVEGRVGGLEQELRVLNTRLGRIEGALGVRPAVDEAD